MIEEWRDVLGYEGIYQVSNLGNVISKTRISEQNRLLQPIKLKKEKVHKGYLRVQLHKGKEYKHKPIHRLVAQSFIDNPENKPQVNHIDEDKTNNRVDNLEWVTAKENMNYGTRPQKQSVKIISRSKSGLMRVFNSITECSKILNINISCVSNVLNGKAKQTKGYVFYRLEET